MKKFLHIIIILVCIVTWKNTQSQNTHHSRPEGGNWADPATWYEGSVPLSLDSVVIQSPVSLISYSNHCSSMMVADTGIVGWGSGGGNIVINGSIYNKGQIGTGLYILFGNIFNDAVFGGTDAVVKFIGAEHTISCAPGKSIDVQFIADDSLQNITLNTDLQIVNKAAIMGNSELFTQNHVLRIQGGSFQDCRIHAFDTLLFNSIIGNLVISGNYLLKGTSEILGSIQLKDDAVNYGKIRSLYGAASELNLYGDLVNNDTIEGSTVGNLNIDVTKSAANHGFWNANVTRFAGPAEKHISQSPGHPFGGTQISSDNSGSTIYLDSDIEFSSPGIYLNNNILNCGLHTLSANSTFDQGIIISESEIQGNNDFWSTQFEGNLVFSGNSRFSNCHADGNIVNRGHMQEITFYGGTFSSYGFLENKGSITGIHMNIFGNLCNTGTVTDNSIVDLVGDTTQYILLTTAIESQCNFYSNINGNSYQWLLNGKEILNQQSQFLFFNTLQLSDAGVYQCRVTTDHGTEYSREIIVNDVTALPENRETNWMCNVYPNPFTQKAMLIVDITKPSSVRITLIDPIGKTLTLLSDENQLPGTYQVEILGSDLTIGINLIQIEIESAGEKSRQILKLMHL